MLLFDLLQLWLKKSCLHSADGADMTCLIHVCFSVQKEEEHNNELTELAQRDQMLLAEVSKLQQQLQAVSNESYVQL